MARAERTVYRSLQRNFTPPELFVIFSPSEEEITWAKENSRSLILCLLVNLKVFQYLGYFPAYDDIPKSIVAHVQNCLGARDTVLKTYTDSKTLYRHRQLIRDSLHVVPWGKNASHIAVQKAAELARIMENSVDLINALIETLIKEYCELPAFSTLELLVRRVKNLINRRIFADMEAKCTLLDTLDTFLEHPENSSRTLFNRLKENPPNSTFMHLKELIERFHWLKSLGDVSPCLKNIPESKTRHFIAEAKALDASEMKDFIPAKRHALLICLLNHSQMQAADDLLTMFCKRITDIHNSGYNTLENLKQKNKEKSERLFALAGKVLQVAKETKSSRAVGIQVLKHIKKMGGIDALYSDYEELELYSGDNFLSLLWPLYKSHRSFLFTFLDLFEFKSTSQDESLIKAIAWIRENRNLRKETIEPDIPLDLSFASGQWQKLVRGKNNPKLLNRHHLEVCVFSCLRDELHSGDICVPGSEEYGDYRERLLSDEECSALLETYCQEMNLPPTASEFVASLKTLLETTAKKADEDYTENESYELSPKGILVLKRRKATGIPPEAQALKEAIQKKMPQHSILEILRNAEHWTGWTRHFGPISGSDPKISDPALRYILTTFTWDCNLGAEQAAKHMGGLVSGTGSNVLIGFHKDTDTKG